MNNDKPARTTGQTLDTTVTSAATASIADT